MLRQYVIVSSSRAGPHMVFTLKPSSTKEGHWILNAARGIAHTPSRQPRYSFNTSSVYAREFVVLNNQIAQMTNVKHLKNI